MERLTMTTTEQIAAAELLLLIKDRAKSEPEKALIWAQTYLAICQAAATHNPPKP